jgi:SAM-dependent methyltransferase
MTAVGSIPSLGAASGMVFEDSGHTVIRYCGGVIHFGIDFFLTIDGMGERNSGQYQAPRRTDFVAGATFFIRTDLARRSGGFDEDYFMYYEDVDLSMRLARSGRHNMVVPSAVCHHLGHPMSEITESGRRYLSRNLRLLYRKRGGLLKRAAHWLFAASQLTRRFLTNPIPYAATPLNKKAMFVFWNSTQQYYSCTAALNQEAPPERKNMAAALPRNGLVLDLGCGGAENARFIENPDRYIGVDVAIQALKTVSKLGARKLICCDLSALPLRDACVGAVISTQVLEHLHEPVPVLHEASRICKHGAPLIIIAPRFDWPFTIPGSLRNRYWGRPFAKLIWAAARAWKDAVDAVRSVAARSIHPIILSPDMTVDGPFLPDDDVVYLVRTPEVVSMVRNSGFEIESISPREWWCNRMHPLVLRARKR